MRICLTQARLIARRIIRKATPADHMVSIIGIRTSSHVDILSVRVSDGWAAVSMIVPLYSLMDWVSGNMMINVDRAITTIIHRASVEMVYRVCALLPGIRRRMTKSIRPMRAICHKEWTKVQPSAFAHSVGTHEVMRFILVYFFSSLSINALISASSSGVVL